MPLKTIAEYEQLAEQAHGHLCAGQILGIRMALYGMNLLSLDDPAGADRKRLVTFVEIDRCVTDAIPVVTGCRLGKRALKFRDFGKVAATFCDLERDRAVRILARETARARARELYPESPTGNQQSRDQQGRNQQSRNQQQMRAYREMPDEDLFAVQWVHVALAPEDVPGYKAPRAVCAQCGEAISFRRELVRDGRTVCRACAGQCYYTPL